MSLVTTAMDSPPESSRQSVAMSELLPVPTGPATPSRRVRRAAPASRSAVFSGDAVFSGNEQPPCRVRVRSGPVVDQRSGARGDVAGGGGRGGLPDHLLDPRGGGQEPVDRGERVAGAELERRGGDRLHVVVERGARGLLGGHA